MGSAEDDYHCSLLESLPARPPTPPRETASHDLDILPKQLIAPQQLLSHPRSLQTPPGVLSPTTSSGDSTARRKRVGFSSQAQYQDPPIYTDPPSRRQQQTPLSLPSSSSRPVKGILKQTAVPNRLGPTNGVYLDTDKPVQVNIAAMLESTLQQLAGADRESKVDAYTMLFRALKASSNLPDRIALQEKMGLFMQFIQRDLSCRTSTGTVDTPMVTSALKLLHTFLHFPGIASSIPVEFGASFVDYCVRSFGDEQAPKEVIRHLMQALYLQNFPVEVMSFERLGRLVTALHDIENHLSGKSIIQSRIHVYEKLVHQCPQQMAAHSDWLQDLFTDMLSSVGEIRAAAARLGLDAAFTLNKDKRLVGRVLDLLNLSLEDKKYVDHIIERLGSMLQNRDESHFVPRIWSATTLFIPSPDQWDRFKPWLDIIRRSFNHSSMQTRREANLAWSRVTYRLFLDHRLDHRPALRLIREPLLSQLKRKGLRDSVLGAIRSFYYYALRPDMNLRILNEIWEMGVTPLLQRLIDNEQEDKANITQAAAILTGLVDCKTRRVWREDRIKDAALIKDDELPAIESKWVRANPQHIFALVGPILVKGFAGISVAGSPFRDLWRALVQSVASASTKDVKLHDDTARFVAAAFTFLLATWKQGPRPGINDKPCTHLEFMDSTRDFILILVEGLGLLPNPFTGNHFVRTKDGQFLPSAPTHRPAKSHGSKRLPLHHLFLLLCHLPPGIPDGDATVQFFDSTFTPFFNGKNEKAQADLAQELLRLLPLDAHCPCGVWVMCATKISVCLERSQHGSLGDSSGVVSNTGPEYRDIVKLLERGLKSSPNLPWIHWNRLFQRLNSRLRDEVGDAGVAVAVVEQLAGAIKDIGPDEHAGIIQTRQLDAAIAILAVSTHPRDKQALDAAKRRLWGSSNAGTRQSSFDPFDNMYKLLIRVLERAYVHIGSCESEQVTKLLSEMEGFFERANPHLALRALTAIQTGLVCWLEDEDHRITRTAFPGVPEAVLLLWKRLCDILVQTTASNLHLDIVEPLFCAAFHSTHREILHITAEAWNRIYEDRDQIEYPETLKTVLASLSTSVEITRPGLEIPDTGSIETHHNFAESQDEISHLSVTPRGRLQPTPHPRPFAPRLSPTSDLNDVCEIFGSKEHVTPSVRTKHKGLTPKPKLRHEDSQLQFAAIEFSPAMIDDDSQLLTDRQQETRARQQETAAMFPEMRSSPTEKTKKAQSTNVQDHPVCTESPRALTPEREGDFEDCLTSTPTPRRGRPVLLTVNDQEMTDPPSSPPEPRNFRLLAELKSQAISNKSLVDWQFSSSPVSGSPNPALQASSAPQSLELDDVDEELRLDEEAPLVQNDEDVQVEQKIFASSQPEINSEIIEETIVFGSTEEVVVPAPPLESSTPHESQSTPSGRQLRSRAIQVTPRSDNDEFVDAPSSPLPPTPSQRVTRQSHLSASLGHPPRQTAHSPSFDVSASFENGMRNLGTGRIEIPLRSSQSNSPKRREYKAYNDILPESPEQALDSIEVAGAESTKPRRGRSKKTPRASVSQSSWPSQSSRLPLNIQVPQGPHVDHSLHTPINQLAASDSFDGFENVSPGNGKWLRKRRRSISSVYSSGGSKKARHNDPDAQDNHQEVPDSQPAAAAAVREDHRVNMQTAEENAENEVSSVPMDGSSSTNHEVSRELPLTTDEPVEELQPQTTPEVDKADEPMEDAGEQTDDEEAIHSQLTREEEQQVSAREDSRLISPSVSPAVPIQPAEIIERRALQDIAASNETDSESRPSTFDGLMNLFKDGLETLRSVNLTREQFYQAEDAFFEMRNELLEAERRGRR